MWRDGPREALDDPEGVVSANVAAQSVLVALLFAVADRRKIASFVQEQAAIDENMLRHPPRRRSAKAIGDWLPESAEGGAGF